MKTWLILFLVACPVVGGAIWYHTSQATGTTNYRTAEIQRGDLLATINATGTIEPEEVVDVGAQVAGMVKTLGRDPQNSSKPIDYGSLVEEGTVLAQIDDSVYKTQVDQARANLQVAEANLLQLKAQLHQAVRAWKRAEKLASKQTISEAEFDTAQAAHESAKSALAVGEAAIAQTRAALQQAEINLGYTTIRCPVRGVIIDRRVNVGQTVVASLNAPSLFLIAKDLKRLQVWASVNEADIGQIYQKQPVRFTVDAYPEDEFYGEVAQIRLNATMTQNVVTYTVVVVTDNSKGKLLPYLTANLHFEIDRRKDTLLVPNYALRWQPQPDQVAIDCRKMLEQEIRRKENDVPSHGEKPRPEAGRLWTDDDGFVRPVEVRVGLTDGMMTEISGNGIKEGLQIVLGELQHDSADGTVTNPFVPKAFRSNSR
jgi:HlyD family secretion protein